VGVPAAAGIAASAPAGWATSHPVWPSPDGSLQGSPGPWAVGDEEQPQQQQLLFPATEQGVAAEVSVVQLQTWPTYEHQACRGGQQRRAALKTLFTAVHRAVAIAHLVGRWFT
jgi:hypothetical protein